MVNTLKGKKLVVHQQSASSRPIHLQIIGASSLFNTGVIKMIERKQLEKILKHYSLNVEDIYDILLGKIPEDFVSLLDESYSKLDFLKTSLALHLMFSNYNITLRELLGPGVHVFTTPLLEKLADLLNVPKYRELSDELGLEEALILLNQVLANVPFAERIRIKKVEPQAFLLDVVNCELSRVVHPLLKTQDAICPLLLAIASLIRSLAGCEVRLGPVELKPNGARGKLRLSW